MECCRSKGQLVVPVFYGVDPSEIRDQTGHFGEAWASMKRESANKIKVLSFRTALQEAVGISPWFEVEAVGVSPGIDVEGLGISPGFEVDAVCR